jgi:hypothetical protein
MASNLKELTVILQPLGFSAEDVRRMLFKQPKILLATGPTIARKLQALRVIQPC